VNNPTSKEDFVSLGKRFASGDIMNALDRLLPRATADLDLLVAGGYKASLLAGLTSLRDRIREHSAGCRSVRGTKQGARAGEGVVLAEGRNVLRRGLALAGQAVSCRQPAPGETDQATREKAAELTGQVDGLRGWVRDDAAELRTRLTALRALLLGADLAPTDEDRAAREAFMARLEALIRGITEQAESKKALHDQSKDKTVAMAELDGRAYHHMRLLSQIGQAVFREAGDKAHASLYCLRELHRKRAKGAGAVAGDLAPVLPLPGPLQPAAPDPAGPSEPITPAVNG
jgi:hypothetical protein